MTVSYRISVTSRARSLEKAGFPRGFSWRAGKQVGGIKASGFSRDGLEKGTGSRIEARWDEYPPPPPRRLSQLAVASRVPSAWSSKVVLGGWLRNRTSSSLPPFCSKQLSLKWMRRQKQQLQEPCVCVVLHFFKLLFKYSWYTRIS